MHLRISKNVLRLIAMFTMLVDHMGVYLFNNNPIMRGIGRIAFPLYAFMTVDGYMHIKDEKSRMRNYLLRMSLLAIVSEPIFDYLHTQHFVSMSCSSVIVTLLLGLIAIITIDSQRVNSFLKGIIVMTTVVAAMLLRSDYSGMGVLAMLGYYGCSKPECLNKLHMFAKGTILAIIPYVMSIVVYAGYDLSRLGVSNLWKFFTDNPWRLAMFTAPLLMLAYNGDNGKRNALLHKVYFWFYPLHLAAIALTLSLIS